ncbi:hypothetical protein Gogos_020476 [Gossypium gossypioides]|uniref:Uncharacterized protein n=1 Tax=Gossypium gossypioides TaxID=34282 RepID=A0A7J9D4N7_GOSGO|nr:hypothetical protein [Gossypium gossypioides]
MDEEGNFYNSSDSLEQQIEQMEIKYYRAKEEKAKMIEEQNLTSDVTGKEKKVYGHNRDRLELSNKVGHTHLNKVDSVTVEVGLKKLNAQSVWVEESDIESGVKENMQYGSLNGVKVHFNPAFEGPEGVEVSPKDRKNGDRDSIGSSGRNPSNTLWGQGSRFKSFGNSQITLVESTEAMVELISSQVSSVTVNDAQKVAASTLDRVTVSRQ